jgi:hypothetical protein
VVASSQRQLTISPRAKAKCLISTRVTFILEQLRNEFHKTAITKPHLSMLVRECVGGRGLSIREGDHEARNAT